jgi:predicted aldo/keto reductase-like oxidoreductase
MPCPVGIQINNCARISQLLRRSPQAGWLSPGGQKMMNLVDECTDCKECIAKCPYELNTPKLLKQNLDDYRKVLSGKIKV